MGRGRKDRRGGGGGDDTSKKGREQRGREGVVGST